MRFSIAASLLAVMGLSVACGAGDRGEDFDRTVAAESTAGVCDSLGLQVSGGHVLPPSWNSCVVALRASMAMLADASTLEALEDQPMAPTAAELQWLSESELGSAAQIRFLSVLLRLPGTAHDVEVRFDSIGAVTYVSAVHKPLQR